MVLAGNPALAQEGHHFLQDLGLAYESCKLGTHSIGSVAVRKDGLNGVASTKADNSSRRSVMSALRTSCIQLADALRRRGRKDLSTVVYILNPFEDKAMLRHVAACFWEFCRSYCGKQPAHSPSNIVLQVVPMTIVTLLDSLIVPSSSNLTRLARNTYDKCSGLTADTSSSFWRIHCSPSVRLARPIPRKINFSLHDTPPKNLMQEAQILHLAYSISADSDWLVAAWTDSTGQHQHTGSFCLAKADHQIVLSAIKDWTLAMMPEKTTWRLIIARVGTLSPKERNIWTDVAAQHIAVTVVDVSTSCPIQTIPAGPELMQPASSAQPGAGFLTPGSTPQAAPSQHVSPENTQNANAPPTPDPNNPSTTASTETVSDPDAHLLDSRDDTWVLVLPFSATQAPDPYIPKRALASGIMLKRGEARPDRPLACLGIDVVENLPPKIPQGGASWLMPRSPEGVLREVMSWYRGLALLGRIRGVKGADEGVLPWHVGVAVAGAAGLDGFLD